VRLARQQVDVVLNHVEPALRRRQPGDPAYPNHPAAVRGKRQGMEEATRSAMLRLGPLARLARAHVLRHVDILDHPEGQASHQRPRLGPTEVSAERPIVALAKHLRAQPAARRDAQPVHGTLPPPDITIFHVISHMISYMISYDMVLPILWVM
jgi:hypothetical protein